MALLPVDEAQVAHSGRRQAARSRKRLALGEAPGPRAGARSSRRGATSRPFDASAMDGYAVRAADVRAAGAILKVIARRAMPDMPGAAR